MGQILRGFLLVLLLLAGIGLLAWGLLNRFAETTYAPIEAKSQELVYKIDHQKVLEACRWVDANRDKLGKAETIDGANGGPAFAALPAVLRQLDFEFIHLEETGITIYFGGGFGHWGLTALRDGAEEPPASPRESRWQLISGLYFWNEFGRFPADPSKPAPMRRSTGYFLAAVAAFGSTVVLRRLTRRRTVSRAKSMGAITPAPTPPDHQASRAGG